MPPLLRVYLAATHLAPLVAKRHLFNRVQRGKEDAARWPEKLGLPTVARPDGPLIWLNAVGLGEVLSLRGLVAAMAERTEATFLVTSTTLQSANVLSKNMPTRTIHQFLPVDAPGYRRAFLDHWQPDLCIWAEQEIWPGFVMDMAQRGVPQALVGARIASESMVKRQRAKGVFSHLYNQMSLRTAYDVATADFMRKIGTPKVPITGSLKAAAPPLAADPNDLAALQTAVAGRFVWMVAPSHAADEAVAIAAHKDLLAIVPDALLIIAPRFPDRTIACDLPMTVRSKGELPLDGTPIYLADTFGDLGSLYPVAQAVLIGGTHDDTEGHSPWEAANLDTAINFGPRIANFADDFGDLLAANAAQPLRNARELAKALHQDMSDQITNAQKVVAKKRQTVDHLAQELVALL